MGLSETRIGGIPGAAGTQRLTRIVGPSAAKELIFTGRRIDARDAYRLGLANVVAPADQLDSVTDELAGHIAANAPLALQYAKQAINMATEHEISGGLAFESAVARVMVASEDYAEGLAAFAERRHPTLSGRLTFSTLRVTIRARCKVTHGRATRCAVDPDRYGTGRAR
jgi:enoyl-CoA hydratase/carnithine racemase